MTYTGKCLCGASTVKINAEVPIQAACHCEDCQKTSGSAYSSNVLPKITEVEMTGDVHEYNSKAASGNTVTRIFCGTCGSALAHKSVAFGEAMAVQTGNFPELHKLPFGMELFTKNRYAGLSEMPNAKAFEAGPPA